jgi:hypothetical protein
MARRGTGRALALAGLALVAGCNERPAREALAETEASIETARPDLEAYAPQDLDALRTAVRQARAELKDGRYTDALRVAQGLPPRIQAAVDRCARRKIELVAAWAVLSERLPALQRGAALRLDDLAEGRAHARGMDDAGQGAARAELTRLTAAWNDAAAAFAAGRLEQAVLAARGLYLDSEALLGRLGAANPSPAAAPARAAPPPPAPATEPSPTPRP